MLRKVLYSMAVLLLVGGIVAWNQLAAAQSSSNEGCPPGYTRYAVLEPIQEGAQASEVTDQSGLPAMCM